MNEFEPAIETYANQLEEFVDLYALPDEWFQRPDHVAIKCADARDYDATIKVLKSDAEYIGEVKMNGRRLASIKLIGCIGFRSFGKIYWVEVMEPRPEKIGKDIVGLEHAEFFYPDFEEVKEVLGSLDVSYEMQSNPNHQWINIGINKRGQELKLNDKPLAEITLEEARAGLMHFL